MSRKIFSHEEKICLQELIIKYKLNSAATLTAGNQGVKKAAWSSLTDEFNSIETNCQRNEAQLKKCWDNLKTRRKAALAVEKRQRMQTGGGSYQPGQSSLTDPELIEEALADQTDIEMTFVVDSDNVPADLINKELPVTVEPGPSGVHSIGSIENIEETARDTNSPESLEPGRAYSRQRSRSHPRTASRLTDRSEGQTPGAKNVRARVINEEFNIRQKKYILAQERDSELHQLQLKEKEWLVKAAEEIYKKACLEKENSAVMLEINKIKLENIKEFNKNL